ncbi:MAG: isoaspartyl peptidase/L-asparaginase family protein [Candidatus Zixiibacteriota bacterium]
MTRFGIAIHGGAGTILKENMIPKLEQQYRAVLSESLTAGYEVLEQGGASLDAVQKAIRSMEDSPLFNAGKGSVFTHDGRHEMDAAIMDGRTLECGAVAAVSGIRNPIDLARLVLEKSPHVMLASGGAERFALANGFNRLPDEYFFTERRWQQLQKILASEENDKSCLDHSTDRELGTVGAVALDRHCNLAAATSTGGMTNKKFGRVGDSAIIGAGTYANNRTCAVSTTGHGEFFMRALSAFDLSALMEYGGKSLEDAANETIMQKLSDLGGSGGLIAIDVDGRVAMPFNTPGMYRGMLISDDALDVQVYGSVSTTPPR